MHPVLQGVTRHGEPPGRRRGPIRRADRPPVPGAGTSGHCAITVRMDDVGTGSSVKDTNTAHPQSNRTVALRVVR